ncbi:MAG TPA: CoA transferase [Burkholderiales bacterium]|nr:CoA transferase [Burkholderiales bacterium]
MMMPLEGLRILAVEVYGAGPFGSAHLADLGAEVIKIEQRPDGDISRGVGPHYLGEGDGHFFQSLNRNKKSLTLDLKQPRGREVFHRLAATADGVMSNLRGDQPEKLGFTYSALSQANPRIVCAHLSAYGRDGARKGWPGYDYLMQAEAGWLSLTGEPDGPPVRMGLSVVDYSTGTTCALALLACILEARRTGKGRDVDVSLYDVAMHQLNYPAAWYLNEGEVTGRAPRSAHPSITPSQLFRTRDGWIFIMAQTQRFWELLCEKLRRMDLVSNSDFVDSPSRRKNRDQLTTILDEVLSKENTEHWLRNLRGAVPCGPVYDMAQALENPYFLERGGVQVLDHPDKPGFKLVASPIRIGEPLPARPAPKLGQHTEELLGDLGFTAPEISELKNDNII